MNLKATFHLAYVFIVLCLSLSARSQDTLQGVPNSQTSSLHTPVVPGSKGDVDGNGLVNLFDLLLARDIVLGRTPSPPSAQIFAADMNSDGSVQGADLNLLWNVVLRKSLPPPTIFTVNPAPARPGDQVQVQGAGFDLSLKNNTATLAGTAVTVVAASATELVIEIPVSGATGNVQVTVGGQKSNAVLLTVASGVGGPTVTAVTPASGLRGEEIVIQGSGFGAQAVGSALQFGTLTASATDIVSWSDTRITARIPSGAFPGLLTVLVNGLPSNRKFLNVTVVQLTAPKDEDIVRRSDGLLYVRNEIALDFRDHVPLDTIAAFLKANNLVQTGIIYRRRLVAARIDDGRDPFALAASLSGHLLVDAANGVPISLSKEVGTESYPNFPGSPRNLLATYSKQKPTFNKDLTRSYYHHFAMHTFEGHRLAEMILDDLVDATPDVRVAVIDGGLGDGTTNDPDEFKFRIRSPTTVGFFAATGASTGLTDLKGIPDGPAHGTPVAGMAGGAGIVSLGTGKHVNIRPLQTSSGTGRFDPILLAGALEIAMDDPRVSVINLSLGSYDPGRSDAANAIGRVGNKAIYGDEVEDAARKGKIVVIAAGNESVDASLSCPQVIAPNEPRGAAALPIMNVSASEPSFINDNLHELLAGFSNFGTRVSVAAPGVFTGVFAGGFLSRSYTSSGGNGTSFSAPLVSGLAAEMMLLDKVLVGLGKRAAVMSPETIVRLIESSADDIGSPGYDASFGHGRINVWKALLATANGGTAAEIASPSWHGFEIRTSLSAPAPALSDAVQGTFTEAQIYVNDFLLQDGFNPNAPGPGPSLNRVVPERVSGGRLLIPTPYETLTSGDLVTTFTVSADVLAGTGSSIPVLQLRQKGKPAGSVPLMELPVNLQRLRSGIAGLVSSHGFVYSLQVPRVLSLASPKGGKQRTLTATVDGKNVVFPVAAKGDTLEFQISFVGFEPTAANTDIQFVAPGRIVLSQPGTSANTPGQPVTSTFRTTVPEFAQTGPVMIKTVAPDGELMVSFSSMTDLIIPRVVGVNPEGWNANDLVKIAVHVPNFTPSSTNTRVILPGSSAEITPEQVLPGADASVTNVLVVRNPGPLGNGPVKVLISVDDNNRVQFEGGGGAIFEKTPYAGMLRITRLVIVDDDVSRDITPQQGKDRIPVRFTLNKTEAVQDGNPVDAYFLSTPGENTMILPFAQLNAIPKLDTLTFERSSSGGGATLTLRMRLVMGQGGVIAGGTFLESVPGYLQIDGTFTLNPETGPPAEYNGIAAGRFVFQRKSGDPLLLEELKERPEGNFSPLGFVQTQDLAGMVPIESRNGSGGTAAPPQLASRTGGIPATNLPEFLRPRFYTMDAAGGYGLLGYVIGPVSGSTARFVIDDAAAYPEGDPDTANNGSVTFDFNKYGSALTGTITCFFDQTRTDSTGTPRRVNATFVFGYNGTVQKEDSTTVAFITVTPAPEGGFPPVSGTTVAINRAMVSFNFSAAEQGTVVLRAFKNNNPSLILAEVEKPIVFLRNRFGTAEFTRFTIQGVGADVSSISLVTGLKAAGSQGFVAQSAVLTYAR